MPIYEYLCKSCEGRTSIFVRSFNVPASARCEHYGSKETEKALTIPSVRTGSLNPDKGKPSAEAQKAAQDAQMREVANAQVQ